MIYVRHLSEYLFTQSECRVIGRVRDRKRDLPSVGSTPLLPQMGIIALGWAEAMSQECPTGLPRGWQGFNYITTFH